MTLACDKNRITFQSHVDSESYSFASVRFNLIFSFCFGYAGNDILNDRIRIFVSRIIRCDDSIIRHSARYFTHLKTSCFRAVSAASENSDYPAFGIFFERIKNALKSSRVVCIIDQDVYSEIIFNRLHSSGYAYRLQSCLHRFDIYSFNIC